MSASLQLALGIYSFLGPRRSPNAITAVPEGISLSRANRRFRRTFAAAVLAGTIGPIAHPYSNTNPPHYIIDREEDEDFSDVDEFVAARAQENHGGRDDEDTE